MPLRINLEPADQVARLLEHVIEQDAESGRMIRSALEWLMSRSCQSATFSERDDCVSANHARQSAQAFPSDGVSLVRHGGASLLAFRKKFFHLQNFRALQMPELGCPAIDARRNQSERGRKFSVPIALHDLRGKRCRLESKFFANSLVQWPDQDGRESQPRRLIFQRECAPSFAQAVPRRAQTRHTSVRVSVRT